MNKVELKDFLNKTIENNKVYHSYLFYGSKIEEFEEDILLFLKQVATSNKENEVKEKLINQIEENLINDFKVVDGNEIKVSNIRDLFSEVYEKPFILDKKIYVIKNYDSLNQNSQNAMLKILEEPPIYVTIVLLSKSITNILDTIKSRCQKYYLSNISNEIANDLEQYDKDKINAISNFFKDANDLEKSIFYGKYSKMIKKDNITEFINYLEKIIELNPIDFHVYLKNIIETKKMLSKNVNFEMVKDNLIINTISLKKK